MLYYDICVWVVFGWVDFEVDLDLWWCFGVCLVCFGFEVLCFGVLCVGFGFGWFVVLFFRLGGLVVVFLVRASGCSVVVLGLG